MNLHSSVAEMTPFRAPEETLGNLRADIAADLLAAAGDIALVIDKAGIIRDIALANGDLARGGFSDWVDKPWVDTVTVESRRKVEQLLKGAADKAGTRWRQVNHPMPEGEIPVRYMAVATGSKGRIVAIGRDLRAAAALQQRLLQAQQSMERDYIRLRQAESRYRQLFELSSEAVLIVSASTWRITEANAAAQALTGPSKGQLAGRALSSLFDAADRDAAVALLGAVAATDKAPSLAVNIASGGIGCNLSATMFRQGRESFFLVRLTPRGDTAQTSKDAARTLNETLERIPDAFTLVDDRFTIVAQNTAFLDLVQLARSEDATGQSLGRFLGRPGIDLGLLASQLREHGSVRNFSTIVRDRFDSQDEVEISAVASLDGNDHLYGISIRSVSNLREPRSDVGSAAHSVEQLTELVGRVPLKEIVRESSDLIERLCIEAALTYTSDNRASAAEILGLSRQSLYSKLHRHGFANAAAAD